MSNKNQEIISDIVFAMRNEGHTGEASCLEWIRAKMTYYADRIEAAHNREIAAKDAEIGKLRECLREAVEWSCGNPDDACGDCVAHGGDTPCKCETWRKMLEGGV